MPRRSKTLYLRRTGAQTLWCSSDSGRRIRCSGDPTGTTKDAGFRDSPGRYGSAGRSVRRPKANCGSKRERRLWLRTERRRSCRTDFRGRCTVTRRIAIRAHKNGIALGPAAREILGIRQGMLYCHLLAQFVYCFFDPKEELPDYAGLLRHLPGRRHPQDPADRPRGLRPNPRGGRGQDLPLPDDRREVRAAGVFRRSPRPTTQTSCGSCTHDPRPRRRRARGYPDAGRFGLYHFGMPPSGALDDYSFRAANLLVGNDEGAAVLEATFSGPTLRVRAGTP